MPRFAAPFGVYLEGQGDLVNRLIMGMIGIIIWLVTPMTHIITPIIPIINLLTKSP